MVSVLRVASSYLRATQAEAEVERFFKDFLPKTEFKGKVKAVGGYVRDQYLSLLKNDPSIEAKDLDILVDMQGGSEKLTSYLHSKIPGVSTPVHMGNYPIWQVTFKKDLLYDGKTYKTKGAVIEFADPMKESYPDPDSRQRKVEPATIEEDIARRDFAANMLLKDLTTGEVEDLTGTSKKDIRDGVLKGHPEVSPDKMFSEDPLRMLRLIRFQVKYDWDIPRFMLKAVKRNAKRIDIVSSERIMGELKKIMKLGKLKTAVKYMSATGLLQRILPEVDALKKTEQSPEHHQEGNVYKHTLMVLENAPPGVESQMAALLHDIGKPATTKLIEDKIKSKGHEHVGGDIAEAIMSRLKFEKKVTKKVRQMVESHMRPHDLGGKKTPSVRAIRRFLRDVGEEVVDSVLDLARADELGKIPSVNNIPDLKKRIEEVKKIPVKKKGILDGREIMSLLGIEKGGPDVGKADKYLIELEDEFANEGKELTKDIAKTRLKKWWVKQ